MQITVTDLFDGVTPETSPITITVVEGSATTGGGGGVTDHGALTGLADDDHTQYHTDARGDARYDALGDAAAAQTAAEATAAAALTTHSADTTSVHGIADTSVLATDAEVATAVSDHAAAANPHPTYLTQAEGDAAYEALGAVATHSADTTVVHGIADTSALETTTGAQTKIDAHVNDATAAHAATAIAFTPAGTISATTVQAAIEEVASEAGGGGGGSMLVRDFAGTTDTLVLADPGKAVTSTGSALATVTIPPNSSVALPVGATLDVAQNGVGRVKVVPGSGVTLRGSDRARAAGRYRALRLRQRAADEWVVQDGVLTEIVAEDTFDRTDATGLGTTSDDCYTWSNLAGVCGTDGDRAYGVSGADPLATFDLGLTDFTMHATVAVVGDGLGFIFRVVDASNYLMMALNGPPGTFALLHRTAGSFTSIATSASQSWAVGDQVRVAASGTTITVYRNGVQIAQGTGVTQHSTATRIGVRLINGGRWNNLRVTS